MNRLFIVFISVIISLFFSCSNNPVVLRINDLKITKTEFAALVAKEKNKQEVETKTPFTKDYFNTWLQTYIDNTLMEQLVEKLGYVSDSEILYKASVFDKAILSQRGGDFFQLFIEKNISVKSGDVASGMKLYPFNYTFEIIDFTSKKQMLEILGTDTACASVADFDRIKSKSSAANNKSSIDTLQWPFKRLIGNMHPVQAMEKGQVRGPLMIYSNPYTPSYCYVKLIDKQLIKKSGESDSVSSQQLGHLMYMYEFDLVFNKKLYSYYEKSKYELNERVVKNCYSKLKLNEKTYEYDTTAFIDLLDSVALTYTFKEKQYRVTVRDFFRFYKYLPMGRPFSSETDFSEFFQDYIIFEYMWQDAADMGYIDKPELTEKRNGLVKKIALEQYYKDSIESKINVSDEEIAEYYKVNIKEYSKPESFTYDLLFFNAYNDAMLSYENLNKHTDKIAETLYTDTNTVKRCITIEKNNRIVGDSISQEKNYNYSAFYSTQVTNVFNKDKFFVLAVKTGEQGNIVTDFELVKEDVKYKVLDQKFTLAKEERLKILKQNSKIENKIIATEYVQ